MSIAVDTPLVIIRYRQIQRCSVGVLYMMLFNSLLIPYSGKLSREKTFANFAILWLSAKVFPLKSFPLYPNPGPSIRDGL